MAGRSKRGSHTKCGVLVCEVGQAFRLAKSEESRKVGRPCHCCYYFLIKIQKLRYQRITFESTDPSGRFIKIESPQEIKENILRELVGK